MTIIYATSPVQAILALVSLERVEEDQPENVWARNHTRFGVDNEEFRQYFLGSSSAIALHLGTVWILTCSVGLGEIRKCWPNFRPPQSFRYLDCKQTRGSVALEVPGNRGLGVVSLGKVVEAQFDLWPLAISEE